MSAAEIRALFEAIDTDGDGRLDHGELTSFLMTVFSRAAKHLPLG